MDVKGTCQHQYRSEIDKIFGKFNIPLICMAHGSNTATLPLHDDTSGVESRSQAWDMCARKISVALV